MICLSVCGIIALERIEKNKCSFFVLKVNLCSGS